MSASTINWVLITDAPMSLDWPQNQLLDMEVEGKKITLAKWKDGYFAFAQKCPHAS
jgi:3-phenylpropionate/trans-cinnamate dioxygenase ferredoxin subunit